MEALADGEELVVDARGPCMGVWLVAIHRWQPDLKGPANLRRKEIVFTQPAEPAPKVNQVYERKGM